MNFYIVRRYGAVKSRSATGEGAPLKTNGKKKNMKVTVSVQTKINMQKSIEANTKLNMNMPMNMNMRVNTMLPMET
jgi:hypothetical protein